MTRLAHAWRALEREQRMAAIAAVGLFFSMLLPWYSKTFFERASGSHAARPAETSLNAFQSFSFVEAAVLLVSAGVLAMLFARAERRTFQLPAGDGLIVMIAGGWAAVLIFYRLLDKPGTKANGTEATTIGVEWGIFIALLVALGLAYAGARMRALEHAHERAAPDAAGGARDRTQRGTAEPDSTAAAAGGYGEGATTVLPSRERPPASARPAPSTAAGAERSRRDPNRPRYPPAPAEQMSFEDPPASAPER